MKVIYEIFRWIGVISGLPAQWIYFKKKIYYEEGAVRARKIRSGALIICNHFCPLDYVMNVLTFFPRKLYVVASEDAFRTKGLVFGMKFWGGIKADRVTRSMSFVKESVRELKNGHLVMIFPEGHNTPDGTIKAFYPSYIVIALLAGVPIIPLAIDGNYGLTKRTHMIIGKPICLSDYLGGRKYTREDVDQLNDIVRQKVLDLRAELDRRIEADRRKGK